MQNRKEECIFTIMFTKALGQNRKAQENSWNWDGKMLHLILVTIQELSTWHVAYKMYVVPRKIILLLHFLGNE